MSEIRPTEEQQAVIDAAIQDDILVIAGAGSGKTFTLMQRITALIEQGVAPEHILGLTFTRKAAAQLLDKVTQVVNAHRGTTAYSLMRPTVMTYDAFFQSIVKRYGLLVGMPQEMTPLSDAGAYQIAADIVGKHIEGALSLRTHNGSHKSFSTIVGEVLSLHDAIAASMIGGDIDTIDAAVARIRQWDDAFAHRFDTLGTPEEYAQAVRAVDSKNANRNLAQMQTIRANVSEREFLLDCVLEFDQAKRERGLAQFSDFTIAAYRLVHRFPSIGHAYRKLFSHVFLDEYQDTSTTQAQLLVSLFRSNSGQTAERSNMGISKSNRSAVTAVGDPFQSIYAWRGASPGAFRLFRQDFAMQDDVPSYTLSQTMRNSQVVLEAANTVTVPLRRPMQVPTSASLREVDVAQLRAKPKAVVGTVGALSVSTQGQQVQAVAQFARLAAQKYRKRAQEEHVSPVAVLMRSKAQIPVYRQAIEAAGLSCEVVGVEGLLQRPDVADMIAVLQALTFRDNPAPLMHVLASPRFALDTQALHTLAGLARATNEQMQYAALVEANAVEPGLTTSKEIRTALRSYRNALAPARTIVDVITNQHFAALLREYVQREHKTLAEPMMCSLIAASQMMRNAEHSMHRSIQEAIYGVFRALQLDIDPIVAASIIRQQEQVQETAESSSTLNARAVSEHELSTGNTNNTSSTQQPATAQTSDTHSELALQAVLQLVDAYTSEQPQGVRPTMAGLLSWINAQRDISGELAPAQGQADVVIMTIHQSKGLEWPAVIIPQLNEEVFPGGGNKATGDNLKITELVAPSEDDVLADTSRADEEHYDGQYQVPEYSENAKTWLHNATSVPPTIRIDHDILPHFPHNASNDADITEQMQSITSLEQLILECTGEINTLTDAVDDAVSGVWRGQRSEYGKRYHDDDRRLMYVALTRSECDALVICSKYSSDMTVPYSGMDVENLVFAGTARKPSNFWKEVYGSLSHASQFTQIPVEDTFGGHIEGIFVGEDADEYYQNVVCEPWEHPLALSTTLERSTWPWHVEPESTRAALRTSAQQVQDAVAQSIQDGQQKQEDTKTQIASDEVDTTQTTNAVGSSPLTKAAQQLIAQGALIPKTPTAPMIMVDTDGSGEANIGETSAERQQALQQVQMLQQLQAQGARILEAGRQSVTQVQHRLTLEHSSVQDQLDYWQGIVRPMPTVESFVAAAGTSFHAWAQEYILPEALSAAGNEESVGQPTMEMLHQWRAPRIEELEQELASLQSENEHAASDLANHAASSDVQNALHAQRYRELQWRKRLVESPWNARLPLWVERSVLMSIEGRIYNGKLDAVFAGGIDEHSRAQYTIIDWKTGKRPTGQDISDKLVQLDLYRLLLARTQGIDIECIDAALYYVSEAQESNRLIVAAGHQEKEIIERLTRL